MRFIRVRAILRYESIKFRVECPTNGTACFPENNIWTWSIDGFYYETKAVEMNRNSLATALETLADWFATDNRKRNRDIGKRSGGETQSKPNYVPFKGSRRNNHELVTLPSIFINTMLILLSLREIGSSNTSNNHNLSNTAKCFLVLYWCFNRRCTIGRRYLHANDIANLMKQDVSKSSSMVDMPRGDYDKYV